MKREKQNLCENYFVLCLNIIVLQSCCLCSFRTLLKVSSRKKVENGLVGQGFAIGIRRFLIQTQPGTQVGLGTKPHYKTPGDLEVSEPVPSRMTQSLPSDNQMTVTKTWTFFLNIFKGYCASAFKMGKCNHVAIRSSCAYIFFPSFQTRQ